MARFRFEKGRHLAAIEPLVVSIGLAQDVARFGDYEHRFHLWHAERKATDFARKLFSAHALAADELRTSAGWLDRLAQAKPTLHSVLVTESALARMDVLENFENVFRSVSGVNPEVVPTWRDLWTLTLCKARRSGAIRRAYRALEGIEKLPTWEQEVEAERRLSATDLEDCEWEEQPTARLFAAEAAGLLRMALFRIAVAVAWFEAEKGAFPETLRDLVPVYLASVPVCPSTGQALRYEKGRVVADAASVRDVNRGDDALFKVDELDWTIRRR